jgi:light-harvesting complex I chlorophyll a/b binding protein 3
VASRCSQNSVAAQETKDRSGDTLLFASDQSLSYLTGELPADYGFDPLGLLDPEGKGAGFVSPAWLQYSEVIHARCVPGPIYASAAAGLLDTCS